MSTLTKLRVEDADTLWPWIREHIQWHLSHWSEAAGLAWDQAAIDARIREGRLIEREWTELLAASEGSDSLVRVSRASDGLPQGAIYVRSRPDVFLGMSVGVLSWLHVDPSLRGQGLSAPLVAAAMRWFADRGLPLAEVHVSAGNEAALAAYAGGGFKVVDHRMVAVIRS